MIAFYILSLVVFTAYVAAILGRYGVPTSISESYYLMPKKYGGPFFNGFCLLAAVPLLVFWLDLSPEKWQFLVFLSCAPLTFVGAAGAFKEIDLTGKVHFVSAGASALFSQLWIVLNTRWWIASLILLALALILNRLVKGKDATGQTRNAWLFFVEMAAFLGIYIALLAYYI